MLVSRHIPDFYAVCNCTYVPRLFLCSIHVAELVTWDRDRKARRFSEVSAVKGKPCLDQVWLSTSLKVAGSEET
jgi:hypothetical protein